MSINKQEIHEQIGHFGEDQLFHLARNESARREYRVAAVELLQQKKSAKADHPELQGLVPKPAQDDELQWGVYPLPETPHESEISPVESGPLKASVTTETMFDVQKVDTDATPADEALIPSTTENEKE